LSDQQEKFVVNVPDDASKTIADELAHQLGSDATALEGGTIDVRRLSVLFPDAITPLMYCSIRGEKNRAFRKVYNSYLNLMISTDGRGRRDIIRMEMAAKSGQTNVDSEINKPGWFGRNVTHRNWAEEEKKRLDI
jgi:hypothetical protein